MGAEIILFTSIRSLPKFLCLLGRKIPEIGVIDGFPVGLHVQYTVGATQKSKRGNKVIKKSPFIRIYPTITSLEVGTLGIIQS